MNRYLDSMKMTAHMTKRKRHDKLLPMKEKDLKIYNISYQSVDTESFSNLVSSVKVKNQQIPPQTFTKYITLTKTKKVVSFFGCYSRALA